MTLKYSTLAIALLAGDGTEPPKEFRLFKAGLFKTTKGPFEFSSESQRSVLAKAAEYGNKLAIDYCHASMGWLMVDPSESGKAAGWIGKLDVRNGGELWAAQVEWCPAAAEKIAAREFAYISPTFFHTEAGEITEVIGAGLTNNPATHHQSPLVAARLAALGIDQPLVPPPKENPPMKILFAALALTETATEAEALDAVTKLKDSERQLLAITGRATVAEAIGVLHAMKQGAEKLPALEAELARIKSAAVEAEVTALVAQGTKEGKLSPAQNEWATGLGRNDISSLKAFLATARALVPTTPFVQRAPGDSSSTELTEDDKKIAKLSGITEVDFAAQKAELAAKAAARRG